MNLDVLGRVPPQNIEAEQSVIGCMLIDKDIISDIFSLIKPSDFYRPDNIEICNTIFELYNKNKPIDLITVSEELNNKGVLSQVGGIEYLSDIAVSIPTTENVKNYCEIIKEKSTRRQAIKYATNVIDKAFDEVYNNAIDIKSDALETLSKIDVNDVKNNKTLSSTAKELREKIVRKRNQPNNSEERLYTGMSEYDYWLDGLHEQEFTIIGARPAVGKTAFGLQIARNLAKKGLHVPFITLEMSDEQLLSRFISSEAKINSHKLRKPKLMTDADFNNYIKAEEYVSSLPIRIEEIKYIQDLRSYCRNLKNKNQLDALFIDYIQLMLTYKKTNSRNEEIGDISRNLKSLSKEFNIPVVALAQLSRLSERDNREPRLSDLRESGDMEQDADNVIFLHKPSDSDDLAEIQDRKIIIAKQRNGATGYFNMLFEGKTFNFMNIAKQNTVQKQTRKEEL